MTKGIYHRRFVHSITILSFTFFAQRLTASQAQQNSPSSTFVGNGGNVQDIDLAATLGVIHDTAANLDPNSETLCTCSSQWSDTQLCTVLRQLPKNEFDACRAMLLRYSNQIADLSARNSNVEYRWADQSISVRTSQGESRIVEAVTQSKKKIVTIQRRRFYEMPTIYRVALLTHELLHMIQHEDKFISDDEPMPPFVSGKAMLDTLGAALAMESYERDFIEDYKPLSRTSQPHKQHWLSIAIGTIDHESKSTKPLLKKNATPSVAATYTFRHGDWGLDLAYESVTHMSDFSSTIHVKESMQLGSLGINYRWFPVNFYLSRWNQTFITAGGGLMSGRAKYEVSDERMTIKDNGIVSALQGSVKLYLPAQDSLWFFVGYQFRQVRYEYREVKIKILDNQNVASIGGAYGF